MKIKYLILCCIFLIISVEPGFNSQLKTLKPDFKKIGKYDDLIMKLKSGDTTVNYFELRMAYTQTPEYQPYSKALDDTRKKMYESLNIRNYTEVLEYATKILDKNYLDLYAHFFSDESYQALKIPLKAKFHNAVWHALLNSIINSGDGMSPESAHLVISPNEEYFVLFIYGFKSIKETSTNYNGDPIDVHEAYNSNTKDTLKIYFNASLFLNSYLNKK